MARKLIAGGLVLAAVLAGAGGVSAFVLTSDHFARLPAAPTAPAAAEPATADDGGAVDLSNWQETRVTLSGSGFVPSPPRRR
jgi:hypothetical protein